MNFIERNMTIAITRAILYPKTRVLFYASSQEVVDICINFLEKLIIINKNLKEEIKVIENNNIYFKNYSIIEFVKQDDKKDTVHGNMSKQDTEEFNEEFYKLYEKIKQLES